MKRTCLSHEVAAVGGPPFVGAMPVKLLACIIALLEVKLLIAMMTTNVIATAMIWD